MMLRPALRMIYRWWPQKIRAGFHAPPACSRQPASSPHYARMRGNHSVQQRYSDVFFSGEFDLGRPSQITSHIDIGDARPIRQLLRRHPQVYLDIIDAETAKMENARVIEPSYSPWASKVVIIKKHDSTPRIMLDYCQLNSVTYKDSYPLPNIADCLDAFKGASYFAVLDLRS